MRALANSSPRPAVGEWVSGFIAHWRTVWHEIDGEFPSALPRYSPAEQENAERELEEFLDRTFSGMAHLRSDRDIENIKTSVRSYMVGSIHGKKFPALDGFLECADQFLRETRKFDPNLPAQEIHQALRNVWIINSIQLCLERPVRLTPSAFAYSLLYPYTDNYLDEPEVTLDRKREFLDSVRTRLGGGRMDESTLLSAKVSRLIAMIEHEFPPSQYPRVAESLLAIHHGQERSICEQGQPQPIDIQDILETSLEKGGTSVLADAFLSAGDLSREMAEFAFGFGAALQFIDDLQDLETDLRNRHETIFTACAGPAALEAQTNRLFGFVGVTLSSSERLFSGEARELSVLSRKSCFLLMLEAIAHLGSRYRPDYPAALEPHSPMRMRHLRDLKPRLETRYRGMLKTLKPLPAAARIPAFS